MHLFLLVDHRAAEAVRGALHEARVPLQLRLQGLLTLELLVERARVHVLDLVHVLAHVLLRRPKLLLGG